MLFENFREFGENIAIINAQNETLNYSQVLRRAQQIIDELGKTRKLIFLIVDNNENSVIAYIACVLGNHPHVLLSADNIQSNQALIQHYKPNVVIDTSDNQVEIEKVNVDEFELHKDLAIMLTTSGSTGSPKLVKLSKKNIYKNTASIIDYLNISKIDRGITTLKFNYSYGLSILNSHLQSGASMVLTNLSANDENLWSTIEKHKVTSFSGVPYSFEMLHRSGINLSDFKSLRYVTQAGGKLHVDMLKHFNKQCLQSAIEFFVMYGQTEAAPRISYLPPKYLSKYPECIGIAVPEGVLSLIDENGNTIEGSDKEGELVYEGPNVMKGYATHSHDLNIFEKIDRLHTGDIAFRNQQGLYKITGRKSRFVKPFGVRTSLDDVQAYLGALGVIAAVVPGFKEKMNIVIEAEEERADKDDLIMQLSQKCKIPGDFFHVTFMPILPRLHNGKLDNRTIEDTLRQPKLSTGQYIKKWISIFVEEIQVCLEIKDSKWESIYQIYQFNFPEKSINNDSSFKTLAGDSLSYVSISSELESYLGRLPAGWEDLSIQKMEDMKLNT